ncbi:acyl carrier protein [Paraburkholderia gardini]|uniref:acyl carrier protein n=1 Tax=Paraburkholderia gardini TaxID=2823469 RepID=UPI001DFAAB3E|nr:acyl carrier protein [Paraburkholderia gardini]CAG4889523.1 Acyl carrier protein [Paraburkholderia gardini]
MQTDIEERVKKEVSFWASCEPDAIKNTDSFLNDFGFDSLDAVEFIMAIEDEFGIEISDEDAAKIATVQQAIDYVMANVKA